jgi:hypothetical protein
VVGKSERLTSSICSSALLNCDVLIASTSNLRSLIPDSDKQHSLKIARREKTDCLCNMARLIQRGFCRAPSSVPLPICAQPSPLDCVALKQWLSIAQYGFLKSPHTQLHTTPAHPPHLNPSLFSNSAVKVYPAYCPAKFSLVTSNLFLGYQNVCAQSFTSSR